MDYAKSHVMVKMILCEGTICQSECVIRNMWREILWNKVFREGPVHEAICTMVNRLNIV